MKIVPHVVGCPSPLSGFPAKKKIAAGLPLTCKRELLFFFVSAVAVPLGLAVGGGRGVAPNFPE